MPPANGLERLGLLLAGVTAIVTAVAFLMVLDHIEARSHLASDQHASAPAAATAATR
jgi:hypothetical protein